MNCIYFIKNGILAQKFTIQQIHGSPATGPTAVAILHNSLIFSVENSKHAS